MSSLRGVVHTGWMSECFWYFCVAYGRKHRGLLMQRPQGSAKPKGEDSMMPTATGDSKAAGAEDVEGFERAVLQLD